MSVIVRGMEMPKCCAECEWHEYYGGDYDWVHACRRTGTMPIENAETGRANDCPLIEIPTPHGRLGDLDKLMTEFMDSDLDHLQRDDWKEVIQIVSDAPTVIEAKGEI